MGKSIILITIDCLRRDTAYNRRICPELSKFREKSKTFINATSVGPATPYAFIGILTSTYPLMFGDENYFIREHNHRMSKKRKPLPEFLEEMGYATAGFHSNAYLSKYFGFDRGFQAFFDNQSLGGNKGRLESQIHKRVSLLPASLYSLVKKIYRSVKKSPLRQTLDDAEINRMAINWLEARDIEKPFFLWMHYMGLHQPYVPGGKENDLDTRRLNNALTEYTRGNSVIQDEDLKKIKDLYEECAAEADSKLGQFLRYLEGKGLLDDSIVIITSDHGDAFREHGLMSHGGPLKEEADYLSMFHRELIDVPLVVYGEGEGIEKSPVSTLSLPPSIALSVGLQPHLSWMGRDIFKKAEGGPQISEGCIEGKKRIAAISNGQAKLIYNLENGKSLLFDLSQDPGEKTPAKDKPTEGQLLKKLLDHFENKKAIAEKMGKLEELGKSF